LSRFENYPDILYFNFAETNINGNFMKNKNVLIITGSPRKNGNSDILADSFIKGAEEAGHTVTRFDAGRKKINGCIACNKCFTKGTACAIKDDFNEAAPFIEAADVIVFSTPLYFYSFTSQIKALIDKLYSFYTGNRSINNKESILLSCGETTIVSDFEGLQRTYDLLVGLHEWTDLGQIIAPEINTKGEMNTKGQAYLKQAAELGRSI